MFLSFVLAILLLGFAVAVHEAGHFIAAKICGAAVPNFSLGMGWKLWSRVFGETCYEIRLLPLGGFVRLLGHEEDQETIDREEKIVRRSGFSDDVAARILTPGRRFSRLNGWQQLFIIFAGPFASLMLGLFCGAAYLRYSGLYDTVTSTVTVAPMSPSEVGTKTQAVEIVKREAPSWKECFTRPIMATFDTFRALPATLPKSDFARDSAGPIGIIDLLASGIEGGFFFSLQIFAIVNAAVGFTNLLPVLPFDGGHIVLAIWKVATPRPMPRWIFKPYLFLGWLVFIALVTTAFISDGRRVIHRQRVLDQMDSQQQEQPSSATTQTS